MTARIEDLRLKGGLIVSCQAARDAPLHGPAFMAAMARAAQMAGAVGIRADAPMDIAAIKGEVDLPMLGIYKIRLPTQHPRVYITPTFEAAVEIARLGCEVIALHVLPEYDRDVAALKDRIRRIKGELEVLVMADIATVPDAVFAVEQGVDLIATTSFRYAYPGERVAGPPIGLIRELVRAVPVPVIGEGSFKTPDECAQAIEAGAHAVVVGTALTAPEKVMAEFVEAMNKAR